MRPSVGACTTSAVSRSPMCGLADGDHDGAYAAFDMRTAFTDAQRSRASLNAELVRHSAVDLARLAARVRHDAAASPDPRERALLLDLARRCETAART